MIQLIKNKIKTNCTMLYLVVLLLVVLLFPIGKVFSAGTGTLDINITPAKTTSVFIDDPNKLNPITVLNGKLTGKVLNEGIHYLIFQDMAGYTTPEPDGNTSNDDTGNKNPAKTDTTNLGRRVYITANQATAINVNYQEESELKQLGRSTAETLLYSGSAISQWSLLRGVAEISADGLNWQKSIAEILYIGTTPQAFIDKYPSNGSKYLVAGAITEYYIDFSSADTPNLTYDASITDTITVTPAAENNKITVVGASIYTGANGYNSTDCKTNLGSGSGPLAFTALSRTITYNIKTTARGCNFRVVLKLKADDSITSNVSITDKADILTSDGAKGSSTFTTSVIPPFAREQNGGDIYSKGKNVDLGPGGGATYIIGSNGDVSATSSNNWILEGYSLRSGSTTDFDPDNNCAANSNTSCGAMLYNINRMEKNYTLLTGNTNKFDFNSGTPEGDVWYSKGDIHIGSGGSVIVSGKGTLLVEGGNVYVDGDISTSGDDILGIIVHNGDVIVSPSVKELDALIYIYSDKGSLNGGAFRTLSSAPLYDKQLTIKGLVIASGYSIKDPTTGNYIRKNAFQLGRNYIGDLTKDLSDPNNRDPAELFKYDGRVINNPPPGFSGRVVKN